MFIRFYPPTPALTGLVKGYQIVHVLTPAELPLPLFPFPPHAVQNLSFYPREPIERYHYRTGKLDRQPSGILVGPQVSRVDIRLGHDLLIVATFFEPGGLHRLLGIPLTEVFDDSFDASLLGNAQIREVDEQLRETDNYDRMQQLVEAFLLRRIGQKPVDKHPIDAAFQLLQDPSRPVSLDYLANQACLSPRQFERQCHQRLGLGPKTFRRIARFSQAYRLKQRRPALSWLDVALSCGYYDFQHLLRDFKEFAHTTPTVILQQETRSLVRPYSSHDF